MTDVVLISNCSVNVISLRVRENSESKCFMTEVTLSGWICDYTISL